MTDFELYPPPLEQLNALQVDESARPASVEYRALGIEQKDVPALIRILADRRYDTAFMPAAWAPLHAWRALGELRAVEAVEPMVALFDRYDDDDWVLEDVPRALALIGAPAIPALARHMAERKHIVWSRIAAADALREIARQYPDVRAECVAILAGQLGEFAGDDAGFNGLLIHDLLELQAVESAPVIEAAYAAERVELEINGDWEDVQVELGLLPARITRRPRYRPAQFDLLPREAAPQQPARSRSRSVTEKRRKKIAKQSRRRNRRRK